MKKFSVKPFSKKNVIPLTLFVRGMTVRGMTNLTIIPHYVHLPLIITDILYNYILVVSKHYTA